MNSLLTFFTALVISVSLIPLLTRLATRFGVVDRPMPRKVHVHPIPRVGGIGIAAGALIPLVLWVPVDDALRSYLLGALVLLGFGIWDDARELSARAKFLGQLLAVIPLVYFGGVSIQFIPFVEPGVMPFWVLQALSVIALIGAINAINVTDGLDGLASGLSLLSLACVAYLAYLAEGWTVVSVSVAVLGGLVGFLRYNTHPATIFMGDSGSQFIGLTLGFVVLQLTQTVNPATSAALPLLLLGLPLADLAGVIVLRLANGVSPFSAGRNHIHHRLLDLGFDHYEAVVVIYVVQTIFVVSALLFAYESDTLLLTLYLGVCAALFVFLSLAERTGWRAHKPNVTSPLTLFLQRLRRSRGFTAGPRFLIMLAVPALLLAASLLVQEVPVDFGIGALLLAPILLSFLFIRNNQDALITRIGVYAAAAFAVYFETGIASARGDWYQTVELVYFGTLALAVAIAARYASSAEFRTTPMDYLVVIVVVTVGVLSQGTQTALGMIAVKLVIVLYACELLLSCSQSRWNTVTLSSLGSLAILGVRGLVL